MGRGRVIDARRGQRRAWSAPMTMTGSRIDLSVDQPTTPVPEAVVEGAATALLDGQTHYVQTGGVAPLIERLRAMLADLGPSGQPPSVLVTAGVQEARFLAIQTLGERLGGLAVPAV